MKILEVIRGQYVDFSQTEKKIADYILQNYEEIKNMNIKTLSSITTASPATITRFCKKIGCKSYAEMKIRLSTEQSVSVSKGEGIFEEVFSYYLRIIGETNKSLNKEMIYEALEMIFNAKRIYIYGVGSSGWTAEELNFRFLKMGLTARCLTNPHLMYVGSKNLNEDDLVIAISSSGATDEIVEALDICRENRVKILSITSFSDSYIAKISDLSLVVFSSRFAGTKKFINTQFAILYLLDILTTIMIEKTEIEENYTEADRYMAERNMSGDKII